MKTLTRRNVTMALMNLGLLVLGPRTSFADGPSEGPQTARIYIYRTSQFTGMALAPSVYCDGQEIGRISNGGYFLLELPAGSHIFNSNAKQEAVVLSVEPGREYYLRLKIVSGIAKGHGKLSTADTPQATKDISRLTAIPVHSAQ